MGSDPRGEAAVRSLLGRHAYHSSPERLVERLCGALLSEADGDLPVDARLLASLCNARIEVVDQREAGCVRWNGRHFVIRVRRSDPRQRQRFTILHEVIHILFLQAGAVGRERTDLAVGAFDARRREEYLCDHGAAELLLPRQEFLARSSDEPDMDSVVELAAAFDASLEATARRLVACGSRPAALVILEPRLKPAELRRMTQTALPGMDAPAFDAKLRVDYSFGVGLPFIPPHKSIGSATPLGQVLDNGEVDYTGPTGLVPGDFRVSARLAPYRRDGALVQRVIALLFEAETPQRALRRHA